MFTVLRRSLFAVVCSGIIMAGASGVTAAPAPVSPVRIQVSSEKARAAALKRVPGTVIKEEYERKRGRTYFEFYIRTDSGEVYEVYVDAESGNVFKVESRDDS